MSLEIVFHDVLDKKETILQQKITFQKAKTVNSAKGLTHDFSQKFQNFLLLSVGKDEPRNTVSRCSR